MIYNVPYNVTLSLRYLKQLELYENPTVETFHERFLVDNHTSAKIDLSIGYLDAEGREENVVETNTDLHSFGKGDNTVLWYHDHHIYAPSSTFTVINDNQDFAAKSFPLAKESNAKERAVKASYLNSVKMFVPNETAVTTDEIVQRAANIMPEIKSEKITNMQFTTSSGSFISFDGADLVSHSDNQGKTVYFDDVNTQDTLVANRVGTGDLNQVFFSLETATGTQYNFELIATDNKALNAEITKQLKMN